MGQAQASVAQMQAYIKKVNPKVADSVIKMIPLYISEGAVEGVRGDIAFAQSCLETGNFTFSGSAVTLSQNNFCGMGVIKNGVKGNSFKRDTFEQVYRSADEAMYRSKRNGKDTWQICTYHGEAEHGAETV